MEGHYRREIASPAFELLSFVRGPRLAALSSPAVLNVMFFLPKPTRVTITAMELQPLTEYRMRANRVDWATGWNTFGPWETETVIRRLRVPLSNIGVVGRVGEETAGSGEIVPVAFVPEPRAGLYELQFRVRYEVERATYTVESQSTQKVVQSGDVRDVAGDTATSIQFDLSNQPEQQYRIVVDCVFKGRTGGPQRSFTFFHKR